MSHCVVIEREIAVSVCPLPDGVCFWKHRLTGACQYDPQAEHLSASDLAAYVGAHPPTDAQVEATKQRIRAAVIAE
ncbi:hypothetical protein D3C87_1608840 [compost metagenome]